MGLVNNFKRLTLFTFSAHSVVRCAIYLSTCRLLSKLSSETETYICVFVRGSFDFSRYLQIYHIYFPFSYLSKIFLFLEQWQLLWQLFFNKVSVSVCRILCKEASRKSNVNLFCTIRIFLNVLYPVAVIIY